MKQSIARFIRLEYFGTYGIRWRFNVPAAIKAGWFASEMKGARKLSAMLKKERK